MENRIFVSSMLTVSLVAVLVFSSQATAGQFSAEIESKLKSGDSDSSVSESNAESGKSDGASGDDEDEFMSEEQQYNNEKNVPMWLAIGPQVGLGPNILFPPKNASSVGTTGIAPFEDGGGGIGGGGGALVSARWLRGRFGLDLGIFAERNQTRTTMTVAGTDNNKFVYKYSIVRIPLLFKFYKLKEQTRWSLGVGPALAVGLESTVGEIQSGEVVQTVLRVKRRSDLLGAVSAGWAIKFNKWLVGIDLKFTYNITGPRDYSERVSSASGGFEIIGSHSLDARVLFGMMYEIGLGGKLR